MVSQRSSKRQSPPLGQSPKLFKKQARFGTLDHSVTKKATKSTGSSSRSGGSRGRRSANADRNLSTMLSRSSTSSGPPSKLNDKDTSYPNIISETKKSSLVAFQSTVNSIFDYPTNAHATKPPRSLSDSEEPSTPQRSTRSSTRAGLKTAGLEVEILFTPSPPATPSASPTSANDLASPSASSSSSSSSTSSSSSSSSNSSHLIIPEEHLYQRVTSDNYEPSPTSLDSSPTHSSTLDASGQGSLSSPTAVRRLCFSNEDEIIRIPGTTKNVFTSPPTPHASNRSQEPSLPTSSASTRGAPPSGPYPPPSSNSCPGAVSNPYSSSRPSSRAPPSPGRGGQSGRGTSGPPSSSNATAGPPSLRPSRPHVARYDLRINLPPSRHQPDAAPRILGETLRGILSQIWEEDSRMVVYPWSDNHIRTNPALVNVSELPSTNGALRRYFSRINPRPAGGQLYVMVRLGLETPMADVMESVGWWFRDHQHGLWARALQAEETVVLGWLLYSTREMDLVVLQDAIRAVNPALEVGLRWRLISLGQAGPIPAEQQVRAIHVEVDKAKVDTIKPLLYQIYGHAATGPFPNGVKMRLVPKITPLMGPLSRAKAARLRNRQANFVRYSLKITTWEFVTLDYMDLKMGASLRDLLMGIKVKDSPQYSLFHSVDAQWQGNGHIITVIPDFHSEACKVLAGILPFLLFHYPNNSNRLAAMFTPAVVERSLSAHWDPVSYSVITAVTHKGRSQQYDSSECKRQHRRHPRDKQNANFYMQTLPLI